MSTVSESSFLGDQGYSDTAASASKRLYPETSVMTYRVNMQTGMGGLVSVDVDAASGDEAAAKALLQAPGSKVTLVDAGPQRKTLSAKAA